MCYYHSCLDFKVRGAGQFLPCDMTDLLCWLHVRHPLGPALVDRGAGDEGDAKGLVEQGEVTVLPEDGHVGRVDGRVGVHALVLCPPVEVVVLGLELAQRRVECAAEACKKKSSL